MPPSPTFHSDTRKWKRRKREITRKQHKHEDDDVEDEDDEQDNHNNNNNNDADNHNLDHRDNADDFQNAAAPDPAGNDTEVLIDGGTRLCDFPSVVRRAVNRPHASVTSIVSAERGNLNGESSSGRSWMVLENISHGQLQAVSAVPADCAALDPERSDSGNSASCVITPPQIMEGKGVVKRFGSRVHVLPMHSGSIYISFD